MSYDRSFIKDYALIRGITLLENVLERLDVQEERLTIISAEWIKNKAPIIRNQIRMIKDTSADNVASKYFVMRLNKLNEHLLSEFPDWEYAVILSIRALSALLRAIRAGSHTWNRVQIQSILEGMGSSHVVKTKKLPYFGYEDDDDDEEKEKKKEKKTKVLEYRPG